MLWCRESQYWAMADAIAQCAPDSDWRTVRAELALWIKGADLESLQPMVQKIVDLTEEMIPFDALRICKVRKAVFFDFYDYESGRLIKGVLLGTSPEKAELERRLLEVTI